MHYLFADAVAKVHNRETLSEGDLWDWHGHVYGWRRARGLAAADERTSPCDPDGKWFDQRRADYAEAHFRAILDDKRQRRQRAVEAALYAA